MYNKYKILALIPARGGSKGVPKKNIKLLAGKPLIAHSIEIARKSRYIDRIVVSTDSEEIMVVAKKYGAEAPFLRPKKIAGDSVPDFPVFEHCLNWLSQKESYTPDIIVHLRPTGPLRTSEQIDKAIELLSLHPEADSVRSVNEPNKPPYKMWIIGEKHMMPLFASLPGIKEPFNAPRQSLPKVYETNANIGVMWWRTITSKKSVIGTKVLPLVINEPVIDIDTEHDFKIAEALLKIRES